jgi:hypothetical protein
MTNKFVLRGIIITLTLIGQTFLNGKIAIANVANGPSENHDRVVPASITGGAAEKAGLLTLNRLRDSGLSLQQIKQQAINIYLEVTRKDVQPTDKPIIVYPKSISNKGLVKTNYLPPRVEWLYFYVGTMEPVIHLFADDVNDTKAGATKIFVPKAAQEPLSPLWQQWSAGIQNLNEHVTAIYKLANEEKPDNIAIGRHAVAMYKIATSLEKTREKGVAIIRKTEQLGQQSETVGIQ